MRVAATTVIRATPEQVWAFITVPENGPRWQEGAIWTRMTTEGPIGLGSKMDHLGRWLRMRVRTRAVVTVFEPPVRYGYDIATRLSPGPSLMRYELDQLPEGATLTLSNEAQLPRWMRIFEAFLQRNVQGMFERDVARLKAVIESEIASERPSSPAGSESP